MNIINFLKLTIMKKLSNHCSYGMAEDRFEQNPFGVKKVAFSRKAIEQIEKTIGSRHAEDGGALFGKPEELESPIPYIREFVFDDSANTTCVTYTINTKKLNPIIHKMWEQDGLELQGLIHSHPVGCRYPSGPDMTYFHRMHTYMDRRFLITPIVFTQPDGGFKIFCYLVGPDTPAIEVDYCVMDETEYKNAIAKIEGKSQEFKVEPEIPIVTEHEVSKGIDYSREEGAVDVALVNKSKIVTVGTGGSYEVSGMLARCGVGEMVGIDPDTVDATNLCRQGYLPRQVGMLKVEALGEYIKEINPNVKYTGYPVKLQDLTPEQEQEIFGSASLVIFTTDSFDAQAYGNKIALRYNIPAIWGGFYEKSMASEIVFYIPGVTPACFRCAVSTRYKFQEEYKAKNNGKELSVSSSCNTIFHSALLDAQIGMLAMAILHNKVEGKTFSGWFGDKFDRNLIQMKVNPNYESKGFNRIFSGAGDAAYLFESYWQFIPPEIPPKYELCPDCHGGVSQQGAIIEQKEVTENGEERQSA